MKPDWGEFAFGVGVVLGTLHRIIDTPDLLGWFKERGVTETTLRSIHYELGYLATAFYHKEDTQ